MNEWLDAAQLVAIVVGAVWAVGTIRVKTAELAQCMKELRSAINRLDKSVDRMDQTTRELDRRVTRLEVTGKTP